MKEKQSREVAINDLNKWYEVLEVPEEDRIDFNSEEGESERDDAMREKVIKAFMVGRLILNKDNLPEYALKHPIQSKESDKIVLEKVTFHLRYREHELEANMKGVNPKDFLPMTRAYISTLTGVSKSILGKCYNADTSIMQAIYTLFTRGDA